MGSNADVGLQGGWVEVAKCWRKWKIRKKISKEKNKLWYIWYDMIYDNVQNEFLFYIFYFQHAGTNTVSTINSRIESKSSNMYIFDIYHSSIICTRSLLHSRNQSLKSWQCEISWSLKRDAIQCPVANKSFSWRKYFFFCTIYVSGCVPNLLYFRI